MRKISRPDWLLAWRSKCPSLRLPLALQGLAWRKLLLAGIAGLLLLELSGLYLAYRDIDPESAPPTIKPATASAEQLQVSNKRLEKKIAALSPKAEYLVIDTARNLVTLRKGNDVLSEMVASCGSGSVLEDTASGRRWVFDTPRGQHRIQSKVKDPLWIKPDWAFLEAGEAIPTDAGKRAERGAMGDYALGIGKGYFIHGTLYTRMLGRNVSHGCVRLGDEDLANLYRRLPIGTQVYIF